MDGRRIISGIVLVGQDRKAKGHEESVKEIQILYTSAQLLTMTSDQDWLTYAVSQSEKNIS